MLAPVPTYVNDQEAAIALSASATKYLNGVKAHAYSGLLVAGFEVSFDSSAATTAVLVEVLYTTWATNSPGTASTATTPRQLNGRVMAAGFTGAQNWSSPPTGGLTAVFPAFYLQPFGGTRGHYWPLGTAPDAALGEGFVIRVVTPSGATPNVRSGLFVSRA